jgi:hypothetical protein
MSLRAPVANQASRRHNTALGCSKPKVTRRQKLLFQRGLELAGSTGLEPAASGVTGRRSNQLNYDPKLKTKKVDSGEVTFALLSTFQPSTFHFPLVGGTGFEPVTAGV